MTIVVFLVLGMHKSDEILFPRGAIGAVYFSDLCQELQQCPEVRCVLYIHHNQNDFCKVWMFPFSSFLHVQQHYSLQVSIFPPVFPPIKAGAKILGKNNQCLQVLRVKCSEDCIHLSITAWLTSGLCGLTEDVSYTLVRFQERTKCSSLKTRNKQGLST